MNISFPVTLPPVPPTFDFYVSTDGNDAWNGLAPVFLGSNTGPKRNFIGGNGALALLSAGKSLGVRNGTYETFIQSLPFGTSWANKVRIANYNSEPVTLTSANSPVIQSTSGAYVEFDGINFTTTSNLEPVGLYAATHHIRLQHGAVTSPSTGVPVQGKGNVTNDKGDGIELIDLEISGIGGSLGVYTGGANILIEDCDVHHVSFAGLQVYDPEVIPSNYILRRNRIHHINTSWFFGVQDTRLFGIILGGNNGQVYDNLIYALSQPPAGQSALAGIQVYRDSGAKLWNNTIANLHANFYAIWIDGGASNVEVRNNIGIGGINKGAYLNLGINTLSTNNLGNTSASGWTNSSDPKFVNGPGEDFHLTALSQARDAGATIAQVTTDYDGVARPQGSAYCIGAFEFV